MHLFHGPLQVLSSTDRNFKSPFFKNLFIIYEQQWSFYSALNVAQAEYTCSQEYIKSKLKFGVSYSLNSRLLDYNVSKREVT